MEASVLKKYLQDIVGLETQKRIAGNTYNRLLIIEKDNTYIHNGSVEKKIGTSSVLKKIKWLPLLVKLYLAWLAAALVVIFFKWTIVFGLMCIRIGIDPKTAEILCAVVCLPAAMIWVIKKEIMKAQESVNQEKEAKIRYQESVEKSKIILPQIQNDKSNLRRVYKQCEDNLKRLYDLNIIHPEYRYLEACGMFLQYIDTGRTHCLEQNGGDTGAYNLYENDLKYNVIKKQLDQVLENQRILYGVLTDINNNVESLCSSVEKIEYYSKQVAHNTKISAWCNSVTATNSYALRRMQEEYIFYR